jgi:TonB family protein
VRFDSPLVLATAGTLAIHVLAAVVADVLVVTHPHRPVDEAPHVELVDVVPVPVPPPDLPPPPAAEPPPPPPKAPPPAPAHEAPKLRAAAATPAPEQPKPAEPPPPPDIAPAPSSGGAPVLAIPDLAPAATGVAVARGPATTGAAGRGGSGSGLGAGKGTGSGDPAAPVSVATIKTRALPRGDFGYFDAGKDYPLEAKRLGIEGTIRVRLVVDAEGRIRSAKLLDKLGHGLDELALRRAAEIRFDAARDTDDHPVTSVVVWKFTMTLPK